MNQLADLFLHRRIAAALVLLLTGIALYGLSQLEVDDKPTSLFRSNDIEYKRLTETWRDFGSDDGDVLVLVEARDGDLFEPEAIAELRRLDSALRETPGVEQVTSLFDLIQPGVLPPRSLLPADGAAPEAFEAASEAARRHPLGLDRLVARDGRAALVIARIEGRDLSIGTIKERVDELRTTVAAWQSGSDMQARLTGVPPLRVVIFEAIRREQALFGALGALVGIIVGLFIFRRLGPVLVTLAASGLAAFWSLGALGLFGVPLDLLTSQLPLLVLVIAYTDAVHLVVHVLRRRGEGLDARAAGDSAVRTLAFPCALTSLTTAIGFASLGLSRVDAIRRFGLLFAAAVALTFIAVLTIVPLASTWMKAGTRGTLTRRWSGLHEPAERVVRAVLRRARAVSLIGCLATVLMTVAALQLVPESRLTEAVPSGDGAAEALADVELHFGGSLWNAVLVEWPTRGALPPQLAPLLADLERALEAEPFSHGVVSARALAAMLPTGADQLGALALLPTQAVRRLLRVDLGKALVPFRVPDAGAAEGNPAYLRLEALLASTAERYPEFELNYTGTGFVARRNVNLVIEDFRRSLLGAVVVIVIVLSVAFRSLRMGMISLIPNILPLSLAGAGLVLLGIELQVASVLAFTICLGVAVDDTIHLLARYRAERAGGLEPEEAAVQAFLHVGRALGATTAVLVGGFGVMGLSSIATTTLFAGICVVALLTALFGDLLILPALLVLSDRAPVKSRP